MLLHVFSKLYGLCVVDTKEYSEDSFRLVHKDRSGIERPLIDIEKRSSGWVAYSTAYAQIISENTCHDSMPLKPDSMCVISANSPSDIFFMLCAAETVLPVKMFSLPHDGTISIGHDQCDITYPFVLVSRSHALLRMEIGRLLLEDCSSTNGTYLNGLPVQTAVLSPGDTIDIFGLRIVYLGSCIAVCSFQSQYTVAAKLHSFTAPGSDRSAQAYATLVSENEDIPFERSPRIAVKQVVESYHIDPPPTAAVAEEMPLIFTVGSSALMSMSSVMMAVMSFQNAQASGGNLMTSIPSMFMAGSMLVGGLIMPAATRKYTNGQQKKKEQDRQNKYRKYLADFDSRIEQLGIRQKEYLLKTYPDHQILCDMVNQRGSLIWNRMPKHRDFLDLRLGNATLPIDVHIDYPKHSFSLDADPLREAVLEFENKQHNIDNAPFILPLKETGILGIYAKRDVRMRYVQDLLLQLCVQHSYTEMKLVLIYSKDHEKEWEWARWMPHLWSDSKEIRAIATDRDSMRTISAYIEALCLNENDNRDSDPHCVVVIDDIHLAEQCPALTEGMRCAHVKPLSVIALADRVSQLPKECKSVVTLNETEGYLYRNIDNMETPVSFSHTAHGTANLREIAARLSRMQLTSLHKETALPEVVPFYSMMRWGHVEQSDLLNRWEKADPISSLAAPVGVDDQGSLIMLDIHQNAHGPHGLVAGMTGSGKSEFIITYILSLATCYSPLEVGFVLIDYKGGGMSDTLKALPHVVGIIDNLDGKAGIRRSMHSLSSELKRRQMIFKSVGERLKQTNLDIHQYQKLFREGKVEEPMQHIVIVSDEFAELKQQEPDFMDDLVSTARIGRSLGVHLILATQKPAGVVNDQILSNTRFRVCLKVQDKNDSQSMLGRPEAATLTKIGRFYLQVGFNEIFQLGQSAWSGAASIPMERYTERPDTSLELLDDQGAVILKAEMPDVNAKIKRSKQVDELVAHICSTAENASINPQKIWLPMLRDDELLDELDKRYAPEYTAYHVDPVIGLVDNPFAQTQYPMQIDMTQGGNVIVYGITGSGKSRFIQAAVYSLCMHHTANEINIYCLDFASEAARMFLNMPQVGDVAVSGEDEKIDKLMQKLKEQLAYRRKLLSIYGGSLESFREHNPDRVLPNILVIIDNYSSFSEGYEKYDDVVYQIVREGPRVGINTLVTCISSNAIRFRMAQNFPQVVCMQMPDKADYSLLLGAGSDVLPHNRSGSGIYADDRVLEFQVANLRRGEASAVYQEIQELGQRMQLNSREHCAERIRLLPDVVSPDMICSNRAVTLAQVPIGLNKETLATVCWNLNERYINAILYDTRFEHPFLENLVEILNRDGKRTIHLLDAAGKCRVPGSASVKRWSGTNMEDGIDAVFAEVLTRHNTSKEAQNEGKETPQFDECVIVINDLAYLYEMLKEDKRKTDMLEALMERGSRQLNMCIIFAQRIAQINAICTHIWYKKNPINEGIWLGGNIKSQYLLPTDGIAHGEKLPEGAFGYIVQNGKRQCVKLVAAGIGV